MRVIRTVQAITICAAALSATACGQSSSGPPPVLGRVPLTPGSRIVADQRSCDRGANAFCSLQLVVVGGHYANSTALLAAEQQRLDALGWTSSVGDSGVEKAADSPGHKLRLTYATASDDLKGVDLGWIPRRPPITRALSRVMFERAPALSLMLETGSS
jgi:hypothetical protein